MCVKDFDKVARTPLDEWFCYLKSGAVGDDATAPGLAEVRERMRVDAMTPEERASYNRHLKNKGYAMSVIETGRDEGREEGRKEGRMEAARSIALALLRKGMPPRDVADATELDEATVRGLKEGASATSEDQ